MYARWTTQWKCEYSPQCNTKYSHHTKAFAVKFMTYILYKLLGRVLCKSISWTLFWTLLSCFATWKLLLWQRFSVLLNRNTETDITARFKTTEYTMNLYIAGFKTRGYFWHHLTYHKHKGLKGVFIRRQCSVISDIIRILGPLLIGFIVPFCTVISTLHEVKIELYEIFPVLLTVSNWPS